VQDIAGGRHSQTGLREGRACVFGTLKGGQLGCGCVLRTMKWVELPGGPHHLDPGGLQKGFGFYSKHCNKMASLSCLKDQPVPYNPEIPPLGLHAKDLKVETTRCVYIHVCRHIIGNNQKVEATQVSISR
jgi:hypothetical protein